MSESVGGALPISASGLSKTYRIGFFMQRTVRALQGLDLQVPQGSIYGLVGPNGAGKSTTLKILMNLVTATSGEAKILGHDPTNAAVRRQVGFLPENPAPYEYLTGREFVTLAGRLSGLSGEELDRRVVEVLGMVDLGRAEKLQIRRYSKGMVQRVALAQALVGRPRLLILDEPTSGLDPIGRRQMRELIHAERARGTTILFCTHIISDVEATCDRVAILVGGRRVREGRLDELVSPGSPTVEFLVTGIDAMRLRTSGLSVIETPDGLIVRAPQEDSHRVMGELMTAGGRIVRVQPIKTSLESFFVDVVKEAGKTVGGEINL